MDIYFRKPALPVWKAVIFHSIFGIMLCFAWYFFKERLYADSAYYIFHSIDSGSFVTANQRIVLALSEVIALAVYYLGGSLHVILVSWSLSHVLFYYFLFFIAFHVHKNEAAAWALVLLQVIGQIWLYYSPMLEICYGAALLVIFTMLLEEKVFTVKRWFWLIVLEILVLTSHPENFVLFFFVMMADVLKNGFRKKVHLTFAAILVASIIFKSLTFSDYEGGKLGFMLDPNQNHLYENLFKKQYLIDVAQIFLQHYQLLLILLLAVTSFFVMRRRWKMLGLFYFCLIGLLVLINATNFAREFTRYNESLYYPVVGLITLTFLFECYVAISSRQKVIVFFLLVVVAAWQMNGIRKNGEYLKLRTLQLEQMVDVSRRDGLKKSLVKLENVEKERWVLNWSYPMETILISSLNGPAATVSLIADEDYDYRDTSIALTQGRFILRRWEIRDNYDLLPFFSLKQGNYVLLNSTDLTKSTGDFSGRVKLNIQTDKSLFAYSRLFMAVGIENSSGKKIPSLPIDKNYFFVTVSNGSQVSTMNIPIDVDISSAYTEVVSCPADTIAKPWNVTVQLVVGGTVITSATEKID